MNNDDKTYRGETEVYLNTPIRQYMDLDYLLLLLNKNEYFVRYKAGFSDRNEKTLPLRDIMPIYPAHHKPSQSKLKDDFAKLSEKHAKYKELARVPTSCWTLRNSENALMWLAYTSKFGACIKSTISKFISAIDTPDYEIVYGAINYHGYSFYNNNELFSKALEFSDEKELRFYFLENKHQDVNGKAGVSFPVKPRELINEVILSPCIAPRVALELSTMLTERYGLRATPSKILMDNC